jgi:hypothetical protein
VVDTLSAQEFWREALGRITAEQVSGIVADLERKSQALRGLLLPGAARLDAVGLREVLRRVFATRRRADEIIGAVGATRLGCAIDHLLDHGTALPARFDAFVELLADVPGQPAGVSGKGVDLAAELLHFTDPDRYWLWNGWLWDPGASTGALRLVTTDDVDLGAGATPGQTYLTVGRATAFVAETGRAAGITAPGSGLFGTDVFLATVYGIYMSTVLRMRLTQEFNRILPVLPDLIRRLLGVHHLEA